jgi:hypothetical protein
MSSKNFVNQFKNTRRHARLQFSKPLVKTGPGAAKPSADRLPWKKTLPGEKAKGERQK